MTHEEDTLDLSNQNLTEIPFSILENRHLKTLYLYENKITEIPEFLTQLKYLESIDLSDNQLTKIPKFFEEYENLKFLNLDNNNIERLDLNFNKLSEFISLEINNNHDFIYIDESIFQAKSAIAFDYEYTKLEKTLTPLDYICKSSFTLYDNYELEHLIRILKRLNGGILPHRCFDDLHSFFLEFQLLGYEPDPEKSLLCGKICHHEMKDLSSAEMYYNHVLEYAKDNGYKKEVKEALELLQELKRI